MPNEMLHENSLSNFPQALSAKKTNIEMGIEWPKEGAD